MLTSRVTCMRCINHSNAKVYSLIVKALCRPVCVSVSLFIDHQRRARIVNSHSLLANHQLKARVVNPRPFLAMAGPECCVPSPSAEYSCVGKEEPVGPLLSYVVQPPSPTSAVVLVSDIFGFEAPILRKLADKTAAAGYIVVVPDYFGKDIYVPGSTTLNDWLPKHKPEDAVENTKKTVEVLKSRGFLSVGAVGFCWGGKVVAELAKKDCLKAAVFCHPSFVTVKDIEDVKTPLAILAAEMDQMTPPSLVKEFQGVLESKAGVESFVHIYAGVNHGWTVRYDLNDKKAVEKAEEAHKKIFEWFGKFLH